MKKLFILLVILGCSGSVAMGDSLTPQLDQERTEAFAPILQNPQLRQLLLENGHAMKQNFTYASLVDPSIDVLLVGESHTDSIPRHDINLMIKDLVTGQKGFSYVASEFLLTSEQPFLDQFAQGKITYDTLKKSCLLTSRAFIALVAKRYGLQVIGLEMPRAHQSTAWAMSLEGLTQRNQSWTALLQAIRKQNPRGKILLYAGSWHTQLDSQYMQTLPVLLAKAGFKTRTIEFVGEHDSQWKKLSIRTRHDILFVIPPQLKPHVRADYVVYASPQDLDEEGRKIVDRTMKALGESFFQDEAVSDGCVYDPDNPICKEFLWVRRAK